MNKHTHMVVGGLSAGVVVVAAASVKKIGIDLGAHSIYPVLMVLPAVAGALGPDVDMPHSTAGRIVRRSLTLALGVVSVLLIAIGAVAVMGRADMLMLSFQLLSTLILVGGLLWFIGKAKHRRETHTGLLCTILLLPGLLTLSDNGLFANILLSVWLGFWLGWLSHLVADSFNGKGVPWLYPLSDKHFHIMSVRTGTKEETIFRNLTIAVMCMAYVLIICVGRWFV